MEGETLHILAEDEVSAEGSLFSEITTDNSESSPVVEFNPLRGKKKKKFLFCLTLGYVRGSRCLACVCIHVGTHVSVSSVRCSCLTEGLRQTPSAVINVVINQRNIDICHPPVCVCIVVVGWGRLM